jgi:hypothetical protein
MPEPALGFVASGQGSVNGMLEEIRRALEGRISPSYTETAALVSAAIDGALVDELGRSLGAVYLDYALDLAFVHSDASQLRPSDDDLLPLVLDTSRFAEGTVFSGTFDGPTGGLDFPGTGELGLTAIAPLSARAIVVSVDPAATDLEFQFNTDDWTEDERGQGIEVVVYREGLPGTPLDDDASTLSFSGFQADAGSDRAFFYVLIVNSSVSTSSSVEVAVTSSVSE